MWARFLILNLLLAVVAPAAAQAWTEPFVKIVYGRDGDLLARPTGARGLAMGMTGVADGTDARNVFFNPAIITLVDGVAVTQSYTDWADQPTFRLNTLELSVSGTRIFSSGGSTRYRLSGSLRYNQQKSELDFNRTIFLPPGTGRSLDGTSDWYANLTLAGAMSTDRFDIAVGTSVKPTMMEITDETLSGVAFDVGAVFRANFGSHDGFRLVPSMGISVLNLGKDLESDNSTVGVEITLPDQVRAGAGLRLETPAREVLGQHSPLFALSANAEVADRSDSGARSFYGGEIDCLGILMLRAGHLAHASHGDMTYGGGLAFAFNSVRIGLDYAQIPNLGPLYDKVESYGAWLVVDL